MVTGGGAYSMHSHRLSSMWRLIVAHSPAPYDWYKDSPDTWLLFRLKTPHCYHCCLIHKIEVVSYNVDLLSGLSCSSREAWENAHVYLIVSFLISMQNLKNLEIKNSIPEMTWMIYRNVKNCLVFVEFHFVVHRLNSFRLPIVLTVRVVSWWSKRSVM